MMWGKLVRDGKGEELVKEKEVLVREGGLVREVLREGGRACEGRRKLVSDGKGVMLVEKEKVLVNGGEDWSRR